MEAAKAGGRGWGVTEEEWLNASIPEHVFEFVCRASSQRKGRLFAAACCRRVEEGFQDALSIRAVELSELYADKQVPYGRLKSVFSEAPNSLDPIKDWQIAFFITRQGKVESPIGVAGLARTI